MRQHETLKMLTDMQHYEHKKVAQQQNTLHKCRTICALQIMN